MKAIIAIDDSPMSAELVNAVVSRKWPEHTQFKILTVLEPICLSATNTDFADCLVKVVNERKERATHFCERIRTKLLSHEPNMIIHFDIREGSPAAEIINAAVEWSADKVFIGSHSKAIGERNVLGSVSQRIASHAPCNVEIVRPRTHAVKADEALCSSIPNKSLTGTKKR